MSSQRDQQASVAPAEDFTHATVDSFSVSLDPTTHHAKPSKTSARQYAVASRYRLISSLGRGGFGEVWRAYDHHLGQDVAIKGPRRDREVTPQLVQSFLEEAAKAQRIKCRGVVPVLDVVQQPTENEGEYICFIVMQWMEGGSLADKLERGAQPSEREAARWVAVLADYLSKIHTEGIVHRDIKPDNILFDRSGQPYLSDFGLAASIEEQRIESRDLMGTVTFMAPEQARKQRVDRQADIYSLGVVLYQLLAIPHVSDRNLALPYLATSADEYLESVADPNQHARTLPEAVAAGLAEIIEQRCLCDDKTRRYRSATELNRALQAWLKNDLVGRRKYLIAAGAACSAAAIGYGGYRWIGQPDDKQRKSERRKRGQSSGAETGEGIKIRSLLDQGGSNSDHLSVSENQTQLTVATSLRSLIAFGIHQADEPVEFEILIKQPQWPGQIGVFFGHAAVPALRGTRYHVLQILRGNDKKYLLDAAVYTYSPSSPTGVHSTHHLGDWVIDNFKSAGNRIRIGLAAGKLDKVYFNGRDLQSFLSRKWTPKLKASEGDCQGDFGVFNMQGLGHFWNPAMGGTQVRIRQ